MPVFSVAPRAWCNDPYVDRDPGTARRDPAAHFTQLSLGGRILRLREQNRLSLRSLADKVELSASFLSQVERDEASPSISSLEKIARALAVDLSSLFLKTQPEPLFRADAQPVTELQGASARLLSGVGGAIKPYRLRLEAGAQFAALPSRNEVFLYVLSGSLTASSGVRQVILNAGDTFHLVLQTSLLTLTNPSAEATEVLAVNYL